VTIESPLKSAHAAGTPAAGTGITLTPRHSPTPTPAERRSPTTSQPQALLISTKRPVQNRENRFSAGSVLNWR
jgi:hypothetical protein